VVSGFIDTADPNFLLVNPNFLANFIDSVSSVLKKMLAFSWTHAVPGNDFNNTFLEI
jgi:hypothetical protein